MKAIRITEPGGPEVLRLVEAPVPVPSGGHILVRVASSGVNRADLLQRRGGYPAPEGSPADIPGLEYAGVVEAIGPEVNRWRPGDRVMGLVGGGGYAEFVVAHERTAVPVPDGLSTVDAGAVPEVFMTAFDAMLLQAGLSSGETVLIHAAGSGVGTAAIQLAAWGGARSIGTSRTPHKLQAAVAYGLDHPVVASEDWIDSVMDLTGGAGVDVILDLVGGAYLEANQAVLAPLGRHVVVGVPGGTRAEIDLRLLMARRATLRGTVLRARSLEEKATLARAFERRVLPGLSRDLLRPVVHATFSPQEIGEAHGTLERNANTGKVLIQW